MPQSGLLGTMNGVRAHRLVDGNKDDNGDDVASTEAVIMPANQSPFSVQGDSGSLVIDTATESVVGMVFGGGPEGTHHPLYASSSHTAKH